MYKLIKIRHDILKQCHVNYMEMKEFSYMPEKDILRNSSQNILGVLRGAFKGFGCPKRHQDALLAKTIITGELAYDGPGKLICHIHTTHTFYACDWDQAYRLSQPDVRRSVVRPASSPVYTNMFTHFSYILLYLKI